MPQERTPAEISEEGHPAQVHSGREGADRAGGADILRPFPYRRICYGSLRTTRTSAQGDSGRIQAIQTSHERSVNPETYMTIEDVILRQAVVMAHVLRQIDESDPKQLIRLDLEVPA